MTDRLELTWPNKDRFLLSPRDEDGKPVWVDRTHPGAVEVRGHEFTGKHGDVGPDPYADNLLITGDSHDALRILCEVPEFRRQYRGKVKLIYIDPPFNTGQTFANYDDWLDHSTWLSMLSDRLRLMKDLLAPNGSIWLHLDDAEQHRARLVLDEVLGPSNFVANVVWNRVDNARGRASTRIVPSHDFITVYSKSERWTANQELTEELPSHYDQVDEQGRPYCSRMLKKFGIGSRREDAPSLFYPIAAPDGTEVYPMKADGSEGRWTWGAEKVERDAHLLEWKRNRQGEWELYKRIYPSDEMSTPFETWWSYQEVGSNRISKLEVKKLFPGMNPFDTPKPEALLARIIHAGTEPGDIVLDCFAGSGTTAAVAAKMSRRWVAVEVNGATASTFLQGRLTKVVDGEDPGGVTERVGWSGGGGFRTVSVLPPLYDVGPGDAVVLTVDPADVQVARAVAGQLGFEVAADPPFIGRRGRMRLAYVPGAVGPEDVVELAGALGGDERLTVVAMAVLPGTEPALAEASPGSRVLKLPRDVLAARRRRGEPR